VEIIVVDNNSKDDSTSAVKEKYPNVILVENKFNAGFSGANNQGMKLASGEFILLLNPDTEIAVDALDLMLAYLVKHNECSIVGPQLLNSDGTLQSSVWKNQTVLDLILETFFLHKFFDTLNYDNDKMQESFLVASISGAALFFKKQLIDNIGMLDEHLFWMEDIDFCYRAKSQGQLIYLPDAKVVHHIGQSAKRNYNIAISNQLLSKLKYYKKHFGFAQAIPGNIFCFLFICSRLFIFAVLSPFKELWMLKLKAYWHTFKKFFRYLFLNDLSLL
jgi:GT2 family glycosyltransferase